jgi:hypothetical protein
MGSVWEKAWWVLKPVNVVKTATYVNYEDCVASNAKWRRMQNRISGLLAQAWRPGIQHTLTAFGLGSERH